MIHITLITSRLGLAHALTTALDGSDYSLTVANSVEQALFASDEKYPQMIILGDTNQSFFYTTHLLHLNPRTKNIPILLYSDNFSIYNPAYVARLGVQATLIAPLSLCQLRQKIHQCLQVSVA